MIHKMKLNERGEIFMLHKMKLNESPFDRIKNV